MKCRWLVILAMLIPRFEASAQSGPSCDLGNSRQLNSVADGQIVYIGGPVFVCDNGTRIVADSAILLRLSGRIDFHGNVRFSEAERSLTAQYAQYLGSERRLMAQQDVVLINRSDGSTLRSASLDYYQQSSTRPTARIDVLSGRPRATLYRRSAAGAGVVDTTVVDADRMQIEGEDIFRGWGTVDIKRGRLTTQSAFAEFDQVGSYMKLYGRPTVDSDTFRLSADSIDADIVNGDEFREVRARRAAKLASEAVNVDAPRLTITFAEGKVERLIALGGERVAAELPQAVATSQDFNLTADSIDARTPAQKLELVIAIGNAFGERHADTADMALPELIRTDWVRGDTVTAYFGDGRDSIAGPAPRAARDTATTDSARVLRRIVAQGEPASSTYKLRERVNDSTEVSVNYITARSIDVTMRRGEVDWVRAAGEIRGMYLQPPKPETVAREDARQ